MGEKWIRAALGLTACLVFAGGEAHAEIAGDDAFSNLAWEQVFEEDLDEKIGVVQSVCATDKYIVTIENVSDRPGEADIVSAYYRTDTDENGNPVAPYTLAKRAADTNWEHGNGMTYNPNTHEIYVALYTSADPENRGCVFAMDPDTLAFRRSIKISDDYNILGIAYDVQKDRYLIQTDADGGYSFKILNPDFQVTEDIGRFAGVGQGDNFQDMEVCGDYIINFPLTIHSGVGDYIQAYSVSEKKMVASEKIDFQFQDIVSDEPESLCELEPGVFLAAVNVTDSAGGRKVRFYRTQIPYCFTVSVVAENGSVPEDVIKVLKGGECTIPYTPDEGYELAEIQINGQAAEPDESREKITLSDIRQDCVVRIAFQEKPPRAVFADVQKKDDQSETGRNAAVRKSSMPPLLMPLAVLFGCIAAGIYGYFLHIKMERKRKSLRARRRQQQYISGF